MKTLLSIFCRFICIFFLVFGVCFSSMAAHRDTIGTGNLMFIENKGQWEKQVLYRSDVNGGVMFLERNTITYAFYDDDAVREIMSFKYLSAEEKSTRPQPDGMVNCHGYKVNFEGSSPGVKVSALRPAQVYNNYYIGNDPKKWASKVLKYEEVNYAGLYPGIDLRVYEKDFLLKYDFLVRAGYDPDVITMVYEGVNDISLQEGNLVIRTSVNRIIEVKPYAYQNIDGREVKVECRFRLNRNRVSFDIKGKYNKQHDLVIDPVLIFSSYSGSTADNWGYTATFDSKGFLYAGGNVFAVGYPLVNAYQANYGGGSCDIAISKYDTTGHFMIYSTYLGGSGTEVPNSLIVDSYDQLFVLGTSSSPNYPVSSNAYDPTFNGGLPYTLTFVLNYTGSDIVVTKFNPDGTALLASTYLGGSGNDGLNMQAPLRYNYADDVRGEIMIDADNNIYVASTTASSNFPVTPGAFQQTFGGGAQDGVLVKMDNNLTTVIWASYLGGNGDDAVYSIVIDQNQNVYVAGGTTSGNFPVTSGVLKPVYQGGNADGFITHIHKNGHQLINSTYWGSNAYDQTYFVRNDNHGDVYVFGQTGASGTTWVTNATWYVNNGGQYISKMNSTLSTLVWSTAFGTGNVGPDISPTAFLVDLCNKIYLSGWGGALNPAGGTAGLPITNDAFQNTTDNNDYYFMVMEDDASGISYGSFFGGNLSSEHVDGGTSRFDKKGMIYQSVCAGCGGHDDFPTTPGSVSTTNNSFNCNNGVIKLDFGLPIIVADFVLPPVICAPGYVNFINTSHTGSSGPIICHWDFGDGSTSTQFNPSHLYTSSGTYTVTLVVSDTGTCNLSDSVSKIVLALSNSNGLLPQQHICLGQFVQIGVPPTGDPSITYQWSPLSGISDSSISNPIATPLQTTTYTLMVSNGVCTDTLLQTVNVYNLIADAGPDTTTCSGTMLLTGNASGGATSYQWSSNPYFTDWLNASPTVNTALVNITAPTTYYLLVSNNWCSDTASVTVDFTVMTGTPAMQEPLCHDDCNGSITVSVVNGTPPLTFSWSNGSTGQSLDSLCAGTYNVTITDAYGCIAMQSVVLANPTPLIYSLTATEIPCLEACVGTITANTSGSTPPYSYAWSNGQTGNVAVNLCEGDYSVTITDDHNCSGVDSASVVLNYIYANMQVWNDKDTIYEGQSTGLHATNIPGVTYYWTPASSVSNNGSANTMVNPIVTTTYYLVATDQYGCEYLDTITIYVIDIICDEPYIYIPNAFTPNGDGNNDEFFLRTQQGNQIYLAVFDRWGEKLFETYDKSIGWDGTFRGKKCDPGVFVYYCEVICYNNQMFTKKGNVTLIR